MRKGCSGSGFVYEGETLVGVALGVDACAEHECGIKQLMEMFEMDRSATGIAKRLIHAHPVEWYQNDKVGGFASNWPGERRNLDHLLLCMEWVEPYVIFKGKPNERHSGGGFQGAWDEGEFAAFSDKPEEIALLKEIYEHIVKDDAILMMAKGAWVMSGGLAIGIASRMPERTKQEWEDFDQKQKRLKAAVAKTGIEEYLKKCGKTYFALRGEFKDETEKELTFLLNPMEQHKYNWGWYSLDDLIAWGENTGRVVKVPK